MRSTFFYVLGNKFILLAFGNMFSLLVRRLRTLEREFRPRHTEC